MFINLWVMQAPNVFIQKRNRRSTEKREMWNVKSFDIWKPWPKNQTSKHLRPNQQKKQHTILYMDFIIDTHLNWFTSFESWRNLFAVFHPIQFGSIEGESCTEKLVIGHSNKTHKTHKNELYDFGNIVFHKWNENKQMQLPNSATLIEKDMRLSDEPYIFVVCREAEEKCICSLNQNASWQKINWICSFLAACFYLLLATMMEIKTEKIPR